MLEWYRRGATCRDIADDLSALLESLGLSAASSFTRLSVRDAYLRYAGWDPWAEWDQDRFDFDMATKVEPAVREAGGGVFLDGYPPEAASLALVRGGVAERWEFYWDGIELANCFTELCDRDEQLRRFEEARAQRRALGEADYPVDMEFIDVVPMMESAAGVALGVDRLVMALVGAGSIVDVRAAV